MTEAKRQQIKHKVEAGQARLNARTDPTLGERVSEKAAATRDQVTAFAKDHPIAIVAGGLAAGVLISALFKGSPTRRLALKAGGKASGLATLGTEMALAYAAKAMAATESAREASADTLEDAGDMVGQSARRMRREAELYAAEAADTARIATRKARKAISRAIRHSVN
ncbi:conserved hypothetical protein [Altererythrobacter sp. B11]|uniref:hypothetical protein n=1 Tax=Altererythrobacter sp. B11 TaxID=2060312 RepID=UPI000DC71193|nr:hypothetical protein [Altererythrobacter sp. B11]BBC72758.1 conserved hypothetical protein [Altererythrobacter sp. B11]